MEEFQNYIESAERNLKVAEHILRVSYPTLQDPKILLAACENIFLAFSNSMSAAVYYERRFKRIPPFAETFAGKLESFSRRIVPRYNIPRETINSLEELRDLLIKHEQSPVEFRKKESLVICDDSYKYETLTAERLDTYLAQAQQFYERMHELVVRHANLFKR